MNEQMDDLLVEGINDTANKRPACCHHTNNGACCWNAHKDFGAGRNGLAAQFHHVSWAFVSLNALTNAVAQSFSTPSQAPTRSLINVALDFDCATDILIQAQDGMMVLPLLSTKPPDSNIFLNKLGLYPATFNWMNRSFFIDSIQWIGVFS
jgi:hypothetical protein